MIASGHPFSARLPVVAAALLCLAAPPLKADTARDDLDLIRRCLTATQPLGDFVATLLPLGLNAAPDGRREELARSLAVTRLAEDLPADSTESLPRALADGTARAAAALGLSAGAGGDGAIVLTSTARPGLAMVVRGRDGAAPVSCDLLFADLAALDDLALALEVYPRQDTALPGTTLAVRDIGPHAGDPAGTVRVLVMRRAKPGPLMLLGHDIVTPGHVAIRREAAP